MIEIIPYIILAIEDDGDREFMAWLYIQYQSLLYSEIIRIVQSSTDAEDVLHTVIIMLKGYKKNGTEKYLKCILKTSRHHSQI